MAIKYNSVMKRENYEEQYYRQYSENNGE